MTIINNAVELKIKFEFGFLIGQIVHSSWVFVPQRRQRSLSDLRWMNGFLQIRNFMIYKMNQIKRLSMKVFTQDNFTSLAVKRRDVFKIRLCWYQVSKVVWPPKSPRIWFCPESVTSLFMIMIVLPIGMIWRPISFWLLIMSFHKYTDLRQSMQI